MTCWTRLSSSTALDARNKKVSNANETNTSRLSYRRPKIIQSGIFYKFNQSSIFLCDDIVIISSRINLKCAKLKTYFGSMFDYYSTINCIRVSLWTSFWYSTIAVAWVCLTCLCFESDWGFSITYGLCHYIRFKDVEFVILKVKL